MPALDKSLESRIEEYCVDEAFDSLLYRVLASREKNPDRRRILLELSRQEEDHKKFWEKLLGRKCGGISRLKLYFYLLLRLVFGLTFTIKFLEKHEENVVEEYKSILGYIEGEDRDVLERIIREEEEHEAKLISQIDEAIVRYMSFIVLGLADAIVEITGVHAGALGVTSSTIMAGITGLIVGFSAAISMASAAYLQAKHETGRSPFFSSLATGVAYISAVVLLAVPYFIIHSILYAFIASLLLAVALITSFSYYGAIVFDRSFKKELAESTGLMLATAFGSYLFGEYLGSVFGIQGLFS